MSAFLHLANFSNSIISIKIGKRQKPQHYSTKNKHLKNIKVTFSKQRYLTIFIFLCTLILNERKTKKISHKLNFTTMRKLLLALSLFSFAFITNAQTDLIITEMVEGWSNNKALEIFNPTSEAIELSEYRVTRYSNGADVPPAEDQWKVDLPTFSLAPYKSYVLVLDKRNPDGEGQEAPVWLQLEERADAFVCPEYNISKAMYFNGDDAVALEKTDGTLVDLFARWGAPRPAEAAFPGSDPKRCWSDTEPYFSGLGFGITAEHTMVKKPNVNVGVTANPTIWNPLADWDTLPANTFSNLGWHKSDVSPANETPVFSKSDYRMVVESSAENGTSVGTVLANDTESDEVKYYLNAGNFVYIGVGEASTRYEPFALNKMTGELTVVDNNGFNIMVQDTFDLMILATDGYSQTKEVLARVILDGEELSISNAVSSAQITLFPNPTINKSFTASTNVDIKNIYVTNVIGQEVFAQNEVDSKYIHVNLENANNGIYLVNINLVDGSTSTQKIILK